MSKAFKSAVVLIVAMMFAGTSNCLFSQEKKISGKDLPPAVKSAFEKSYPQAKIKGLAKETENGKTYFEVESVDGKLRRDLLYTPEGDVYEIEETFDAKTLPQAVKDVLQKKFGKYSVTKAERTTHGTEMQYDLALKCGKKSFEASIDPTGKILNSKETKAKKEKGEKEDKDEEEDD